MLLLTAFEPFDGTGINSSEATLHEFMRRSGQTLPITTKILPVVYEADFTMVWETATHLEPKAILHLGQTSGAVVAVERMAINLRLLNPELRKSTMQLSGNAPVEAQPANTPPVAQVVHTPILEDAPAAYFATIPVDEIMSALFNAGIPATDSAHAGTYLCNHILFRSLHHVAVNGLNIPVGFLHLPRLPEQAGHSEAAIPTLPLDTLVKGLEIAVDTISRSVL